MRQSEYNNEISASSMLAARMKSRDFVGGSRVTRRAIAMLATAVIAA